MNKITRIKFRWYFHQKRVLFLDPIQMTFFFELFLSSKRRLWNFLTKTAREHAILAAVVRKPPKDETWVTET